MTSFFCKNRFLGQQRYLLVIFAAAILACLLLTALKQERKVVSHNKPHCLKGYICQAAIKNMGR